MSTLVCGGHQNSPALFYRRLCPPAPSRQPGFYLLQASFPSVTLPPAPQRTPLSHLQAHVPCVEDSLIFPYVSDSLFQSHRFLHDSFPQHFCLSLFYCLTGLRFPFVALEQTQAGSC